MLHSYLVGLAATYCLLSNFMRLSNEEKQMNNDRVTLLPVRWGWYKLAGYISGWIGDSKSVSK